MAKYKVIPIDLYKRQVTVFIGSHKEFKNWASEYKDLKSWEDTIEAIENSDDDAAGSYWYNSNDGNGIIELPEHPKSKEEIAIAAHECLHCVIRCLSYVGVPLYHGESNEPYTYLLEYLLANVLDYDNYEIINL